MKLFVFCLIVVAPFFSNAQVFPFDLWHDGKIILESGDTIKGSVKYSLEDLVQIKHDNRLDNFTARKVLSFEIFDQGYRRFRQFYSLPYSSTSGYKTPTFFELVSEGKITVLSREKIEYRSANMSPFYYGGFYQQRKVMVDVYFLLRENGDIESFTNKKNNWYELMSNKENDVREYVKESKLDFDQKYQLKQIIDYYNSFFTAKQ